MKLAFDVSSVPMLPSAEVTMDFTKRWACSPRAALTSSFQAGKTMGSLSALSMRSSSSSSLLKKPAASWNLGLAIRRLAWAATWSAVASCLPSAAVNSMSSGMLLCRKYDRREAMAYASSGTSLPQASAATGSTM